MLLHKVLLKVRHVITGISFIIGITLAITTIQIVENEFMPIKKNTYISSMVIKGNDIWIEGYSTKIRACKFIYPVRAVTTEGVSLLVISSNPTASQNWIASDYPQKFGPWQFIDAVGTNFKIFQEYECHPGWSQFQTAGRINSIDTSYLKFTPN